MAAGQLTSIALLTAAQCCAQLSVSNSRAGSSLVQLCQGQLTSSSAPRLSSSFSQILSWGAFSSRGLPNRGKGWRGQGELGLGWTLSSPSFTCYCCCGRLEIEISYWLVHLRLYLDLCLLSCLADTEDSCLTDQGSLLLISIMLKEVVAFISTDIKTCSNWLVPQMTPENFFSGIIMVVVTENLVLTVIRFRDIKMSWMLNSVTDLHQENRTIVPICKINQPYWSLDSSQHLLPSLSQVANICLLSRKNRACSAEADQVLC